MASQLAPVAEDVSGGSSGSTMEDSAGRSLYTGGAGGRPTSAKGHPKNSGRGSTEIEPYTVTGDYSAVYSTTRGSPGGERGRRPGSAPLTKPRSSLWDSPFYTSDLRPIPANSTPMYKCSPYGPSVGDGGGGGPGASSGRHEVHPAGGIAAIHASRRRVDTTVAALMTREKETLAEEVLMLRRRHHQTETRLKLATTDALRAGAELRRRDRDLLALEKEKQARNLHLALPSSSEAVARTTSGKGMHNIHGSGSSGDASGGGRAASETLVSRLKARVGELKATVGTLSAELVSTKSSARATRVSELEAESRVYLSEVMRLTRILGGAPLDGGQAEGGRDNAPSSVSTSTFTPRGSKTDRSNPLLARVSMRRGGGRGNSSGTSIAAAAAVEQNLALSAELTESRVVTTRLYKELAQLRAQLAFGPRADTSGGGGSGAGGDSDMDSKALAAAEERVDASEARAGELYAQAEQLRQDRERFRRLAAVESAAAVAAREEAALAEGEAAGAQTALALLREHVAALGEQLAEASHEGAREVPPSSPLTSSVPCRSPSLPTPAQSTSTPSSPSPSLLPAVAAATAAIAVATSSPALPHLVPASEALKPQSEPELEAEVSAREPGAAFNPDIDDGTTEYEEEENGGGGEEELDDLPEDPNILKPRSEAELEVEVSAREPGAASDPDVEDGTTEYEEQENEGEGEEELDDLPEDLDILKPRSEPELEAEVSPHEPGAASDPDVDDDTTIDEQEDSWGGGQEELDGLPEDLDMSFE